MTSCYTTIYREGDAAQPTTAARGSDFRIDLIDYAWAPCPITAGGWKDCGYTLKEHCRDNRSCKDVCELLGWKANDGTISCMSPNQHCQTKVLSVADDGSDAEKYPATTAFVYFGCGSDGITSLDFFAAATTTGPARNSPSSASGYLAIPDSSFIAESTEPSTTPPRTTGTITKRPTTSTFPGQSGSPTRSTGDTASTSPTAELDGNNSDGALNNSSSSSADKTSSNSTSSDNSAVNPGIIIGSVLGSIAMLSVAAVVIVFLLKRRRQKPMTPQYIGGFKSDTASSWAGDNAALWSERQAAYAANGGWGPSELVGRDDDVWGRPTYPAQLSDDGIVVGEPGIRTVPGMMSRSPGPRPPPPPAMLFPVEMQTSANYPELPHYGHGHVRGEGGN